MLLLRFAITQEHSDQSAVLTMADQLDSIGMNWRPGGPRFFRKTSQDVCDAIQSGGNAHNAVLRKHAARIENIRLRRAFLAAIDIRQTTDLKRVATGKTAARQKLWRGLAEHRGGSRL